VLLLLLPRRLQHCCCCWNFSICPQPCIPISIPNSQVSTHTAPSTPAQQVKNATCTPTVKTKLRAAGINCNSVPVDTPVTKALEAARKKGINVPQRHPEAAAEVNASQAAGGSATPTARGKGASNFIFL